MPAFCGLTRQPVDGRKRPAFAVVVAGAARRRQAVSGGARRRHQGDPGLVRRAGFCRGRNRNSAGFAGQRDPSACAAHRTRRRRWRARRRVTCGPRRNSPARNCWRRAKQKIFEFARVFRDRERGDLHLPEFTMLEWYRANATYDAVMADSIVVIAHAAQATGIGRFSFRGKIADPFAEPELLTVAAAFERFAGIDLLATIGGRRRRSRGAGGGGKRAGADHRRRHLVGHFQQGAGRACRAESGAGAFDGAVRISGAGSGAGARQSRPIRASPSASRSMPAASSSPTDLAN